MEENTSSFSFKAKRFLKECIRVLKITKKPSNMEFKTIVKVSGLGMIIIGMIGFVLQLIKQVLIN